MDEHAKLRYLKDIEYFSAKLDINPSSKVFMPLSLAYLRLEKYDEVISVCQTGLDSNPEYIAAKTIMAQAFLGKGLREEAKGLLIEVATLNKDNFRANKLLGEIYRAEDNPEKALYYYRTALLSAPEDSALRRMIEELAGVTDLKPATLEEIEYEQSKTDTLLDGEDDESAEKDLINEVTDLAEDLDLEDLGEDTEAIDLLDAEQKISDLLQMNDFEGARTYVNNNFADDDEYKAKKLKEIDAEESLRDMDDGVEEPPLAGLEVEENEPKEIVIPEETDSDDLEMADLFGDEFDVSLDDAPEDAAPIELDFVSDSTEEGVEETAEDLLGSDFLDEGAAVEIDDSTESLADLDFSVEPVELSEESVSDGAVEELEVVETDGSDLTESEGAVEERFDEILDEKMISAEVAVEESAELVDTQLPDVNAEAVEKLEGWMQNISKAKSSRNV